jgi:hypothetical protein
MLTDPVNQALSTIADYYDQCKVGYEGTEGYRKSTDLQKLTRCLQELTTLGLIDSKKSVFADLGCADGRVNVLASYFVRSSIGIEIDPDILDEFTLRKDTLFRGMQESELPLPPDNIALFHGSSLDEETYRRVKAETGFGFSDINVFYTYITLHDLFAEEIAAKATDGAIYVVYGFNKVLPRYDGLDLLIPDIAEQGIAALYTKKSLSVDMPAHNRL